MRPMKNEKVQTTCESLLAALLELDVVLEGRVWNRIPGKERVYVDLVRLDGGPHDNAGAGHTMFIDARTGFTCFDRFRQWAGPKTQAYHRTSRTVQQVKAVVRRFVPEDDVVAEAVRRSLLEEEAAA